MAIIKIISEGKYRWPESIDFDRDGNLYFSDEAERALFRIKRSKNGSLDSAGEKLLGSFEHAGGISIDRQNHCLYFGVRAGGKGAILQVPLRFFDTHTNIDYPAFRPEASEESASRPVELEIETKEGKPKSARPNGVVFDRRQKKAFYTHTNPFGLKGFVGNTNSLPVREFGAPNGIDVDPIAEHTLVIALSRKNTVIRWNAAQNVQTTGPKFGCVLDGLLCLENGDVLVASFLSGKIFHLTRDGDSYKDPRLLVDGLDRPTDLAVSRSSEGEGLSLFVTSTVLHRRLFPFLKPGGKIWEIQNLGEVIES